MNFGRKQKKILFWSHWRNFWKFGCSGSLAHLNLEFRNGSAWVKLTCQLGPPAGHSYLPHHPGPLRHAHPRVRRKHKGSAHQEKDRARAAAHRAKIGQAYLNSSPTPPAASTGPQPPHPATVPTAVLSSSWSCLAPLSSPRSCSRIWSTTTPCQSNLPAQPAAVQPGHPLSRHRAAAVDPAAHDVNVIDQFCTDSELALFGRTEKNQRRRNKEVVRKSKIWVQS